MFHALSMIGLLPSQPGSYQVVRSTLPGFGGCNRDMISSLFRRSEPGHTKKFGHSHAPATCTAPCCNHACPGFMTHVYTHKLLLKFRKNNENEKATSLLCGGCMQMNTCCESKASGARSRPSSLSFASLSPLCVRGLAPSQPGFG